VMGISSPYWLHKWVLKVSDDGILHFNLPGSSAYWDRTRVSKSGSVSSSV
jgi:hypothetical protein